MKYLLVAFLVGCSLCCFSQIGTIKGHVMDKESKEPLLFANVALYQNGELVSGVQTDFDGNYELNDIKVGVYDLEVTYLGYLTSRIEKIDANTIQNIIVDFKMEEATSQITYCPLLYYRIPIYKQDNFSSGRIIGSEDIEKLPIKN